jgi:fumarate reductase flavoprotein subunit
MVAAARAAELSGKKVIVLEKDSKTGGGALNATGVAYFGSKWAAKHNEEDTTVAYAREKMDEVYWRLDENLIYNLLRGTGQLLDWLLELDPSLEDLLESRGSMMGGDFPGPEMNQQKAGKRWPKYIVDKMMEKCGQYGVEILTEHPVVDVEVKNGKIVAAIAKSEKGCVRIACKACIMSIGSWINNDEIVKKYYPKFYGKTKYMTSSSHWAPTLTGDGIALAEKIGAYLDYDSFVIRLMGPMFMGATSSTFRAMGSSPYKITVNLDGKRYCSEPISRMGEFDGGAVQLEQPNGLSYAVFDENTIEAQLKKQKSSGTSQGAGQGMPGGRGGSLPDTMEAVRADIQQAISRGGSSMFQADTLKELADKIGVNKKNFLETIKKYNENCETGIDTEFFKDKENMVPINKAPYYASLGTLGTDGAFGGILVNPEIQAYKSGGGLVEGLYVTGDFASGRHINMGGIKRQVVHDMTWAFASGFLAGTNVAKYLKSI